MRPLAASISMRNANSSRFRPIVVSLPIHVDALPIVDERLIDVVDHVFAAEETIGRENGFDFVFDLVAGRQAGGAVDEG